MGTEAMVGAARAVRGATAAWATVSGARGVREAREAVLDVEGVKAKEGAAEGVKGEMEGEEASCRQTPREGAGRGQSLTCIDRLSFQGAAGNSLCCNTCSFSL